MRMRTVAGMALSHGERWLVPGPPPHVIQRERTHGGGDRRDVLRLVAEEVGAERVVRQVSNSSRRQRARSASLRWPRFTVIQASGVEGCRSPLSIGCDDAVRQRDSPRPFEDLDWATYVVGLSIVGWSPRSAGALATRGGVDHVPGGTGPRSPTVKRLRG